MRGRTVAAEPDSAACSWARRECRLRRADCCGVAGVWQCAALVPHRTFASRPQHILVHSLLECHRLPAAGGPRTALGAYALLAVLLTAAPPGSVQLVSLLCVFLAQHTAL